MALGEGPALRVLPREADGGAFLEQRGEGQRLGVRPVYESRSPRFFWKRRSSLEFGVKPSGTSRRASFSPESLSAATAVSGILTSGVYSSSGRSLLP